MKWRGGAFRGNFPSGFYGMHTIEDRAKKRPSFSCMDLLSAPTLVAVLPQPAGSEVDCVVIVIAVVNAWVSG